MEPLKPYKKDFEYSYALGAFPTFELLNKCPKAAKQVLVHSTFTEREKLEQLCKKLSIPVVESDKQIARLSDKENVFVIGVYDKFELSLSSDKPHLMLVNPSNMGNLGTILRTCLAMDIRDVAIIRPGVDVHNPKVVRASMGAVFSLRIQYFENFEEYKEHFPCEKPRGELDDGRRRYVYSFMLTGEKQLTAGNCPKPKLYTLCFGNEATGLPEKFAEYGEGILIPQSEDVDSLNLTIAVGIGTYLFRHHME